jgi:hypothetical protein
VWRQRAPKSSRRNAIDSYRGPRKAISSRRRSGGRLGAVNHALATYCQPAERRFRQESPSFQDGRHASRCQACDVPSMRCFNRALRGHPQASLCCRVVNLRRATRRIPPHNVPGSRATTVDKMPHARARTAYAAVRTSASPGPGDHVSSEEVATLSHIACACF